MKPPVDSGSSSLADVLERVLDKGVVIVGDIAVNVMDIELLTLRVRLFVASVQTAREMGMDWWTNDPFFTPHAQRGMVEQERAELRGRIVELEKALAERTPAGLPAAPHTQKEAPPWTTEKGSAPT